jgi:chromosome segregation protein
VYQTKPSPFCILDEVDAPLDDANVDVYNAMIREFTQSKIDGGRGSQFIVITHKKRTMQKADAVYGITQNEPGVSTKISVKFEDIEAGLGHLTDAGGAGELLPTVRGSGPFSG